MNPVLELRLRTAEVARGFDPSRLSGEEAVGCLQDLGVVRRLVDGMIAGTAAHAEAKEAHRGRGDRSAAETCTKSLGSGAHEGRGMVEAGKAMRKSEPLADAVRAGRVTPAQAVMIGQTTTIAPDAEACLLAAAERGLQPLRDACIEARREVEDEAARSERQRRGRRLRTWTDLDGMFAGSFALTPEIGGQIKAIIDDHVGRALRTRRGTDNQEPIEAYAADALTEAFLGAVEDALLDDATLEDRSDRTTDSTPGEGPDEADCEGASVDDPGRADRVQHPADGVRNPSTRDSLERDRAADGPAAREHAAGAAAARDASGARPRRTITTHVLIDLEALLRGSAIPGERCEIPGVGPVNVAWVRAHLPESFLTAVIAHGTDIRTVAHFGRHINAKLRTALLVQGRECDVAGCTARGYLEIDHAHDHAKRGPTSLANLGWLCAHHHRQKTSGWVLGGRDPTGKRTLTPPPHATSTGPDPPATDGIAA